MRQYPIGIQDFKEIRENGWLYVDKTEYMYRMTHTAGKYYFLSRPRRFGKSLLVSTLRYYFEGCKELFEGLAVSELEKEWEAYPVLRFDLSKAKNLNLEQLVNSIGVQISRLEDVYGVNSKETTLGDRLGGLIMRANAKTGKKVVLLVDEYDAPLLDVIHDKEQVSAVRKIFANFYSNLKDSGEYLRFVFITGISKFSQLGLFSGLNNIKNISMLKDYAAICGITKKELTEQMSEDIDILAEEKGLTRDETIELLTKHYDGYHFTWPSEDIFNPYSLLNAFSDRTIKDYWYESGTSQYLIEMIHKYNIPPTNIGIKRAVVSDFDVPLESASNYVPLFYQSGYLTITGFDEESQTYTLEIPNEEVEKGLINNLLVSYMSGDMSLKKTDALIDIRTALKTDDIEAALVARCCSAHTDTTIRD